MRNEGLRPVSVTGIGGGGRKDCGCACGTTSASTIPVGGELSIPLSIRLTCADTYVGTADRRADHSAGPTAEPPASDVDLEPAALVLDVAGTLCAVRPDLRDHELSGPVLRGVAAKGDAGRLNCRHAGAR